MRLFEVLQESMTMWIPDAPTIDTKHPCFKCEGDKQYDTGEEIKPCEMCLDTTGKPTGYWTDKESTAPEMNLSNTNAIVAMVALGYEESYGYGISPKEIPGVKRKIMMLLNKKGELEKHTTPPTDDQKDFGTVRSKDPVTGLDKIERKKGPRMIGSGRDVSYLTNVFKRMLVILDYAQKHNMEISFA